jgi:hypothetical protein
MFPLGMLHLCPLAAALRHSACPGKTCCAHAPVSPTRPHSHSLPLLHVVFFTVLFLATALPLSAFAEPIRVSAAADPGADPVQARQQIQERVFAEAVFQTAQRLLPSPLPESRAALLRQYLTPRAAQFVQSFQESPAAKPNAPASAVQSPVQTSVQTQTQPLSLEMDVEVSRAALSDLLLRLGLLAGARHPHVFALRLAGGLTEKDLKLGDLLVLQGLSRTAAAPVQLSLERVPQGYLKAVLRQETKAFVADGQDMDKVWLDVWGQYFSAREQQPGVWAMPIEISGFALVDEVLDFTKVLASWDDCLREVRLHRVDVRPGNNAAHWTARVTSPERLNARLNEYLPGRKLTAVR